MAKHSLSFGGAGGIAIKLLPYLKPYRWAVGLALLQVFLSTGFELLKPWPLQVVIDNVLGGKPFPIGRLQSLPPSLLLLLACLGIVIVHFGAGALTLLHNYTTIRVGQRMVNDLRGTLYAHLQRLSLAYHSGQLCRPDDDHEWCAADFVGGGVALRHVDRAFPARFNLDPPCADRRS